MLTVRKVRWFPLGEHLRLICAGLVITNGSCACLAVLLGWVAFLGVDEAHPTEGRVLLAAAAVFAGAAWWAIALVRRSPYHEAAFFSGAMGGLLAVLALILFFYDFLFVPLPLRTWTVLLLLAVQLAAVPVMFLLIRRNTRVETRKRGEGHTQ